MKQKYRALKHTEVEHVEGFKDELTFLDVCLQCGSVVADIALHTQFHDRVTGTYTEGR
jgi:hypothetical protein